jgi:YD repeat-containing protein
VWAKRAAAALAASLLIAGGANAITYAYDSQGRVIEVVYDNGAAIIYAYDAAGNRTTVSITGPSTTRWDVFSWGGANWQ